MAWISSRELEGEQPQGFERAIFWSLIFLVVATRLAVACAHYNALIAQAIYTDDSFYYLTIARNIVAGRGMTFDGVSLTNGFHPLYMGLLVLAIKLVGTDIQPPILAAGVISTSWAVITAGLVFSLTRRLAGVKAGLLALAVWAFHPYFIVYGINGLETSAALCFIVAVIWAYWFCFKTTVNPTARGAALLGSLAGFAILARSDSLILFVVLSIDAALTAYRRQNKGRQVRWLLSVAVLCLLVWLPWGIYSFEKTGFWLPLSGPAGREVALNLGWFELDPVWSGVKDQSTLDPAHPPFGYFADVATKFGFTFLLERAGAYAKQTELTPQE